MHAHIPLRIHCPSLSPFYFSLLSPSRALSLSNTHTHTTEPASLGSTNMSAFSAKSDEEGGGGMWEETATPSKLKILSVRDAYLSAPRQV